jgi:NADH dehydrogenase
MIMITGGTGFIGNVLIRHLSDLGYPIKLLLRPAQESPKLPKGLPMEVAVASLNDQKSLRAVMKDVDVIYHLVSAESFGREAQLSEVDIKGTQALVAAASQANISRIFYLSHLGADRASAYPLLKAKAIAENEIKSSGIPYTIIRSGIVFGEQDHFTNGLAFLLKISPYFVMLPDNGSALLQPIWVEDLARVLTWSLDMAQTINETIEVGGPEYLTFKDVCQTILDQLGIKRQFINVKPVILSRFTETLEILFPSFPTSVFWLDYLSTNRTANLDTLPSRFDLLPARLSHRLGYLKNKKFRMNWRQIILNRKRTITRWE